MWSIGEWGFLCLVLKSGKDLTLISKHKINKNKCKIPVCVKTFHFLNMDINGYKCQPNTLRNFYACFMHDSKKLPYVLSFVMFREYPCLMKP
jgi:hypothetical protein